MDDRTLIKALVGKHEQQIFWIGMVLVVGYFVNRNAFRKLETTISDLCRRQEDKEA